MLLRRASFGIKALESPLRLLSACPFSADYTRVQERQATSRGASTVSSALAEAAETSKAVPFGRVANKSTGNSSGRRTVNDLPLDYVEALILKYASVKQPVKLGRRRITNNIAEEIQRRWNTEACVKLHAVHKETRANMKTLVFEVEEITGGLVIWVSGNKLIVYSDQQHNELRKQWQIVDKQRRLEQSRMNKHIDC